MSENLSEPAFPDNAMVSIIKKGDTWPTNEIVVSTDIDNFNISGGGRDVETRPFFLGANVTIKQPQERFEVTMNAKLQKAIWDQMMQGGTGSDFTSGGEQNDYRIIFCVTTDTDVTAANTPYSAIGSGYDTYRVIFADANMISFEPTLEAEGMLEGEATFAVAAKDGDAASNIRYQIGDSGFAALGSYTTSQKWD